MKKIYTTLLFIIKDNKILLAQKKRGFGCGKYNGVGGKVQTNETIKQALIRETKEEINVMPLNYKKMATINFDEFMNNENVLVKMSVFVSNDFNGVICESEEMCPQWFNLENVPYDLMFPDEKIWLPYVLNNKRIKAYFKLDKNFSIENYKIKNIM